MITTGSLEPGQLYATALGRGERDPNVQKSRMSCRPDPLPLSRHGICRPTSRTITSQTLF